MDELFREIKTTGYLRDIGKCPENERWDKLTEIVSRLNIFKAEMTDLSEDEQLYLAFEVQSGGVDMGLCPDFYIFFSGKNEKFHHACKAMKKERVYCRGRDKSKCILST
jgi:hypothetical protein